MTSAPSIPRARRPSLRTASGLLALALLAAAADVVRGEDPPRGTAAPTSATTGLTLGAPVPPTAPSDAEKGVGLLVLETGAGTVAALRTDGRILVMEGGTERVEAPPPDAGEFRVLAVAGDGVPVVVTTRGRLVLLEPAGVRVLPLAVQRSAKPAAIPGSTDVVLGSENGSIRRLLRAEAGARLEVVVPPGDEPVGALAAGVDRVAYARLDGVVLEASFAGGAPRELARPARTVQAVRVIGTRVHLLEDGAFYEVGATLVPDSCAPRAPADAAPPAPARAAAVANDGRFVALLVGDTIEVRRLADGARAATSALAGREPSAIAFADGGRTLLVATASSARPWRIAIETRAATAR